MREFSRVIDDPNAPPRLRGKTVKVVLTDQKIEFQIDLLDDMTPNEIGYFRWSVGEIVDKVEKMTNITMTYDGLETRQADGVSVIYGGAEKKS